MNNTRTHYVSCRGEFGQDIQLLADLIRQRYPTAQFKRVAYSREPDPQSGNDVVFKTIPLTMGEVAAEIWFPEPVEFEMVLAIIREIEDGHVMLQTLRPLELRLHRTERNFDQR